MKIKILKFDFDTGVSSGLELQDGERRRAIDDAALQ